MKKKLTGITLATMVAFSATTSAHAAPGWWQDVVGFFTCNDRGDDLFAHCHW